MNRLSEIFFFSKKWVLFILEVIVSPTFMDILLVAYLKIKNNFVETMMLSVSI